MVSLIEIMEAFNARLEKDDLKERFELQHFNYEWQGKEISYDALIIPHAQDEISIQLSYERGWILYYLGFHEHLDFVESIDDLFEMAYRIVVHVLKDEYIAARVKYQEKRSDGMLGKGVCCYVPKEIPFTFSEEERKEARISRAVCWSDKEIDEDSVCYILSEREDVLKHKEQFM